MSILKEIKKNWKPILFGVMPLVVITLFCFKKEEKVDFNIGLSDNTSTQQQDVFAVPMDRLGIDKPELLLVDKNSFKSTYPPFTIATKVLGSLMGGHDADSTTEIREYIVKKGDTLSSIADKFNITVDTIAWANDIDSSMIQPGDKLIILPTTGVMHLVEKGDTVKEIAERYNADKRDIISFNDLSGRDKIFEGEVLIVPDGELSSHSSIWDYSSGLSGLSTNDYYGKSHSYPYGQCTWWVAQKRPIPSLGNANMWINNAAASGYSVCRGRYCPPAAGAVISLKGDRVYGHVGYVEKVEGDQVVFSEMNYIGLGKMNYRSLPVTSPLIQGYIY